MLNKVTCGDCLDLMRELPDNYVSSIITDPPYELNFMGKSWDNTGIAFNVEVWAECLRVAKSGAFLLAFGGTRTWHRIACAIEDAGWTLRDTIAWHYGSGFPKSLDISKALDKQAGAEREVVETIPDRWAGKGAVYCRALQNEHDTVNITAPSTELAKQFDGYGTALKPSFEPIMVFMKPCDGTFAQNAENWGIAGLNIDGGRIAHNEECRMMKSQYDDEPAPFFAQAGRHGDVLELKPEGRWPANTILSCACDGEHAEDCPVRIMDEQSNGASRFFYCAKPSKSEKNLGLEDFMPQERYQQGYYSQSPVCSVCNKTFNGTNNHDECGENTMIYKSKEENKVAKNIHPTCKPISLLRYLCKLTRPPHGGIVLDPFSGSGTTGIAAILEDRDFIGFELSQEYTDIANARIEHHAKQAQEDLCLSI